MAISNIKNQIKTVLDELVTSGVISSAIISDIKRDPLNVDYPSHPCAVIMPPATESEILDNRTLTRTFTFDIMVLVNAENLANVTELETMIESILNKFDNDPTLGGYANAGIPPTSSAPQPFQHGGKDLIMVVIRLQPKETVSLTFS